MNEDVSWTILNKCKDSISLMGIPSFKTDEQKITPISFKHTDYIIEDIDDSNLKCRTYFVKILELNENLATNMKVTFVSDTLREKDDEQKKSPKVIIEYDRVNYLYQGQIYKR